MVGELREPIYDESLIILLDDIALSMGFELPFMKLGSDDKKSVIGHAAKRVEYNLHPFGKKAKGGIISLNQLTRPIGYR